MSVLGKCFHKAPAFNNLNNELGRCSEVGRSEFGSGSSVDAVAYSHVDGPTMILIMKLTVQVSEGECNVEAGMFKHSSFPKCVGSPGMNTPLINLQPNLG